MTSPTSLRKAAKQLEQARLHLEDEMRQAHQEGAPLRAIAEAAGVSHEQVRRIVQRSE